MKILSGWVITYVCIIVVLFLTITPFVQMVDADNYLGYIYYCETHTCLSCGESYIVIVDVEYLELSHQPDHTPEEVENPKRHIDYSHFIHDGSYDIPICNICLYEVWTSS